MRRSVLVRDVLIGGGAPVSVQSMTNTDTRNIDATVEQIKRLEDAGCDIVRFSVYDSECAQAVSSIKKRTRIPLVADIHFDYRLAIAAIESGIDKIRFNPGNIGDDANVKKLCECAKAHGVPVRIGVNSGSVERPLLKKYGRPSPQAMVESAMRHVRLLESENFYDIVISLKASNVTDTVEAYRIISETTDYPLHVGVTEAGFGESAVIKSAVGIGSLLLAGIGDTIRVSLTGDPVNEVIAAKSILRSIGLEKRGAEVISCPTCGRTTGDLESVARRVQSELSCVKRAMRVAVMGCVVNGPGEAREADIGIAFAPGGAVVFKNGEKLFSGDSERAVELLITEAKAMDKLD